MTTLVQDDALSAIASDQVAFAISIKFRRDDFCGRRTEHAVGLIPGAARRPPARLHIVQIWKDRRKVSTRMQRHASLGHCRHDRSWDGIERGRDVSLITAA